MFYEFYYFLTPFYYFCPSKRFLQHHLPRSFRLEVYGRKFQIFQTTHSANMNYF